MQNGNRSNGQWKTYAILLTAGMFGNAGWTLGADAPQPAHVVAAAAPQAAAPAAPAQPVRQAPPTSPPPANATPVRQPSHAPVAAAPVAPATPQTRTENQPGQDHDRDHDHGEHHRDRNVGVYEGEPNWGDTYWNDGNYNDVTYTPNGSAPDTGTNSTPASTPPQPVVPSEASPSAASAAAMVSNAVDKSPEMVAANNDVQLVQAAYDRERERVLAALTAKPEYQKALARKHDAQHDLHEARQSAAPSPAVVDAATVKLDTSDEVTKMQEQAVAIDAAASAAKQHLAEAVAHRDQLRAKMIANAQH